jgi:hypothetical protein
MAERLNFREACQRAGVSRQRLNGAIKSGRLPAERGGGPGKPTYINLEDLQSWCVSEGLAMPVEAVERSERSTSNELRLLMERLERLAVSLDRLERLERLVEQVLERLERSPIQATEQRPAERSHRTPKTLSATAADREDIIARIRQAKDIEKKSYRQIANALNQAGIATFSGRGLWQKGSIERYYKGKTD